MIHHAETFDHSVTDVLGGITIPGCSRHKVTSIYTDGRLSITGLKRLINTLHGVFRFLYSYHLLKVFGIYISIIVLNID